ncbi:MAG: hypothetical protein JWN34_3294, partial [Bryobacterales bacterium]|nr:hypothetical protein [Bryobacterales bacterium]
MRTGLTYLATFAACLVAVVTSVFAAAPLPPVSSLDDLNYSRRVWQSRDGLPEDFVLSLAQTPDGYLWVGTSAGLLRFDGVGFTTFGPGTDPAFLDDSIYSLLAARDGSLWIGTEGGGLVHHTSGKFRAYGPDQGLTNSFVRDIYEDHASIIWLATDRGLFRLDGDKFTRLDARNGIPSLSLNAICEDGKGRLLAGGNGLLVIDHGTEHFYAVPANRRDEGVRFLKEDAHGVLWIGTVAGVRRLEGGLQGDPFALPRVLDVHARVIYESPAGLWIGTTDAGLLRWSNGRFSRFLAPASLPNDNVLSIEGDREGNFWIGTQGGLTRISPSAARTLHVPRGDAESINTIYADPSGPMLVVSQGGKIYDVRGNHLVPHALPAGLASVPFRNAFRSRDGSLWLGTLGRGIYRVSGAKTVAHFSMADGLVNDFTRLFMEARDGSLWIGTNGGVSHFVGGKFKSYNFENGLVYNSVREIIEDRSGAIWVATDGGISRLVNDRFIDPGALAALRGKKVWALHED